MKRVNDPYKRGRGRYRAAELTHVIVINDLAAHDGSSATAIAQRTKINRNTVGKHLHETEKAGFARHEGEKRHRHWFLL